ncbi:MAG: chemotaxis-specific protein-glutamate methyltransferase CheB [Planctomycetaceae bacterium]
MTTIIRILIADDSAIMRRLILQAINQQSGMEIAAIAKNGAEAIECFKTQAPDLVLLDTEMPGVSGLQALEAIRALDAKVPVILFGPIRSELISSRDAAIAAGANEWVAKPPAAGHVDRVLAWLQTELIARMHALMGRQAECRATLYSRGIEIASPDDVDMTVIAPSIYPKLFSRTLPFPRRNSQPQRPVIVMGAATGGPNALAKVIGELPRNIGAPILIVQHLPPIFTKLLAERLDQLTALSVREGYDGAIVNAGEVWIAPGDAHMTVERNGAEIVLRTNQAPAINSNRPAIDALFQSVAEVCGSNCLAVVLTGLGDDGTAGCRAIRQSGAEILVQDEASSAAWGMPGAIVDAGLASSVLSLEDIAPAIAMRIQGWMEFSPDPTKAGKPEAVS